MTDMYAQESSAHRTIKETPEALRPREKLIARGAAALDTSELLAIIIRSGTRACNAQELGRRVLELYGNDLKSLYGAKISELISNDELKGIGAAKACQILAAIELGRRIFLQAESQAPAVISSAQDAADYLIPRLRFYKQEHFCVLLMDTKNKVTACETVTTGTLSASLVHPREIFATAVRHHAAKLILAHNHPSGDPAPSREDIRVTRELSEAGEIMQIPVLDHIIVGGSRYVSLKQENLF